MTATSRLHVGAVGNVGTLPAAKEHDERLEPMKPLRIYEMGLYLVTRQERAVFADASRGMVPVQYVMSGARLRRSREIDDDVRPFNPNNDGTYALMDGHLPEYQPRTDGAGVETAILADRWLAARVVPPEPEPERVPWVEVRRETAYGGTFDLPNAIRVF